MNKIALVTGASRGLGKNMALRLAAKGNDVIITYLNSEQQALQVVNEIKAMGQKSIALKLDMSDLKSFTHFQEQLELNLNNGWNTNRFDYLINNAGTGATMLISEVNEEAFDELMNIHFKGVYFLTQQLINKLNDGGSVVFISSGTTERCVHGYSLYSSLKSAIETFTKYVAKEYGNRGIRANVVAPGAIETDFNNGAVRSNPQMQEYLSSITALGRTGQPNDIGGVVAFLCSDDAKWVNGQRLEVSGGVGL